MIHRAKFQNFKALRDVEVAFDSRLTVLVGPNGSGKTSVLQGIYFLCQAAEFGSSGNSFNINSLRGYLSSGADLTDLKLEAATTSGDGEVVVQIGETVIRDVRRPENTSLLQSRTRFQYDGQSRESIDRPAPPSLTRPFRAAKFLRLDADRLAAPSQPDSVPPKMRPDGVGLASVLAYLALNQPERFQAVVAAFRQVIRAVRGVRFDKVQQQGFSDVLLFDFHGATGVRAADASTGTLFALGLVAAILGPTPPTLLLLDDLDHGLHPKAQMDLVDVLRKLLTHYPDLQIIATSHSPYILDRLEWNEVRVTSLQDDGSAVCVPLTAHPEVERWREAMTPGEFWSHLGDDWVKKVGRPEPAPAAP